MDSLTQAALGAAVGEAVLGKKIGNKAPVIGAVIGTFPDLDVFLMLLFDEFREISIHRGYSHSIVFCLVGAFLFAYILNSSGVRLKYFLRHNLTGQPISFI